jgi:adenylate kinase
MMARGRSDDTEEAITRRLELYDEQTAPLLEWFESHGLLETVDGCGTEEAVFARLCATVGARLG